MQNYVRAGRPVTGDQLIGPPPSVAPSSRSDLEAGLVDGSSAVSRSAFPPMDSRAGGEGAIWPGVLAANSPAGSTDTRSLWAKQGTVVSTLPQTPAVTSPPFAGKSTVGGGPVSAAQVGGPTVGEVSSRTLIAAAPTSGPEPYVGTLGPFRDQLARDRALGSSAPGAELGLGPVPDKADEASAPGVRPSSGGLASAWIRAITNLLKFSPALIALGGAFYFYHTLFGKMSADELAAQGLATPEVAKQGGISRAEVMIQQTKAVTAAQSRNVDFANQLAEFGADAVDPHAVVAKPAESAPSVVPAEPVASAPTPPPPPVTVFAPSGSPRELVFSGPPPSPAFVRWARESRLSGVRASATSSRAMVDNVVYGVGDTVHRPLRIVLERVDAREKVVIFRDGSGSTVARPF